MKALYTMLYTSCFLWCIVFHDAFGQASSEEKIKQERYYIVPGRGSDGIVLGDAVEDMVRRFGKSKFKISRPSRLSELFKDVFNVSSKTRIYFDMMYYNDEDKFAVCVYREHIVAIIGFDNERITSDSVHLNSGVNNFIFNYGNRHLLVIRSGSHGIYLYRERGMAVIDDDMNDSIDLYLVFTPTAVSVK